MFRRHVSKLLSPYRDGELPEERSRQVAEHLISCARCRAEYEEIRFGATLASSLEPLEAPDSIWPDVQAALARRTDARPKMLGGWLPLAAAAAALIVIAVALWSYDSPPGPGWDVQSLAGSPSINSRRIGERGTLTVGQWLITDEQSKANLKVADIGNVELDPNSKLRLLATEPTQHRLELAVGRMHATISAPPRLFFVETPSALAIDYGCIYTLDVDDSGEGLLHVTSGWVALVKDERESMVPGDAMCLTRPGTGPGTPYFEDAPEALRAALTSFDFEGGGGNAVDVVIAEARVRDTLTLWHLLFRLDPEKRAQVYARLVELEPPPDGVTRDGVLSLDLAMLNEWMRKMTWSWY